MLTELPENLAARYVRQILLPEVDETGQLALLNARVLIIGAGGLGVPSSLYLAAGGVGTLGISDSDHIETSNLHRQVAYAATQTGEPKNASLREQLLSNNPHCNIRLHPAVDDENVETIIAQYDLVLDGCDNYPTRFRVNRACRKLGVPLLSSAVERFEGQLALFTKDTPCYQCLLPEPPDLQTSQGCVAGGILGPMAGVLGTLQALEAMKYLIGLSELAGKLILVDGYSLQTRSIGLSFREQCPVCADKL